MNVPEPIRVEIENINSLIWCHDSFADWTTTLRRIFPDGSVSNEQINYAYRFDAAEISRSGKFVAIYEKLGTKALVVNTESGEIVRELSRSYYCAEAYEYPICFVSLPDGREAIAHCPDKYCRIELEEVESGKLLTASNEREPMDVFHSRLAQSPDGNWLLSAGWEWHPTDGAHAWQLSDILQEPAVLDSEESRIAFDGEVASAAFLDDDLMVVAGGDENFDGEPVPNSLSVLNATTRTLVGTLPLPKPAGTVVPVTARLVLCLFEHPRLLDVVSGESIAEWPMLNTGTQTSSITHHKNGVPAFALSPETPMFAVADEHAVSIVDLRTIVGAH